MSESTAGSAVSSSSFASDHQNLPTEVLTSILSELEPWDAWPLRLVCKNFDSYLLRVLGPRIYLPQTCIYIRRAESWIFYNPSPNYFTPPSSAVDLSDIAQPFNHHRGQKFVFSGLHFRRTFGSPPRARELAHYIPARDEERGVIQEKLEAEVQVIVLIKCRYYRQVRLPSLAINRDSLTLSFDWKEMLCATLPLPENIRRMQDMRPNVVWIPEPEDDDLEEHGFVRHMWLDNMGDGGSDMQQDSDRDEDFREAGYSSSSESSEDGFDLGAITPTPGSLLFAQMYGSTGVLEEEDSELPPSGGGSALPIVSPSSSTRSKESYWGGDRAESLGLARIVGDDERISEVADTKSPPIHRSSVAQLSEEIVLHTSEIAGSSRTLSTWDIADGERWIPSEEDSAAFGASPGAAVVTSAEVSHDSAEGISRSNRRSKPMVHESSFGFHDLSSDKERSPHIFLPGHSSHATNRSSSTIERNTRRTLEYQEQGTQLEEGLIYQEKGVQAGPVQRATSRAMDIFRLIGRRFSWP